MSGQRLPALLAAQIEAAVLGAVRRDGRLPWGFLGELAQRSGVSKDYVSSVRKRLGIPSSYRRGAGRDQRGEWATCPECHASYYLTANRLNKSREAARRGVIRYPEWWIPTCSQACGAKRGGRHRRGVQ